MVTRNDVGGAAVALLVAGLFSPANADEAYAKQQMKAMSDYMAAQKTIAFAYDANLDIVTKDHQKITFANSGTVILGRPDKLRASRDGGFSNTEVIFDGTVLTVLHKDTNFYAQAEVPGTIDHLIDELRTKFHKPVPGADLLMANVYDQLMPEVTDTKDLGSGVIGGAECDHFAFRTAEVDWQIWIAQGDRPYPCRYVITTKKIEQGPQYSVQVSEWVTSDDVDTNDFTFDNTTNAKKIDSVEKLGDIDEVPNQFKGDAQ